jgi:hypothetical protein
VSEFTRGVVEHPDLTVTVSFEDFRAVIQRRLSEEEAMARGRVDGDLSRLMPSLAPLRESQAYEDFEATIASLTTD